MLGYVIKECRHIPRISSVMRQSSPVIQANGNQCSDFRFCVWLQCVKSCKDSRNQISLAVIIKWLSRTMTIIVDNVSQGRHSYVFMGFLSFCGGHLVLLISSCFTRCWWWNGSISVIGGRNHGSNTLAPCVATDATATSHDKVTEDGKMTGLQEIESSILIFVMAAGNKNSENANITCHRCASYTFEEKLPCVFKNLTHNKKGD